MAIELQNIFDPTKYSLEECQFLIDHLGESPFVALQSIKSAPLPDPPRDPATGKLKDKNPVYYPGGVVPASVESTLRRIVELEEDQRVNGRVWAGLDAVKRCLQTYLDQSRKWAEQKRLGAPRFPSMHSFDLKNKPHLGGPGSDSGKVSTYFGPDGGRYPLAMPLFGTSGAAWEPEWATTRKGTDLPHADSGLHVDAVNHRFECLVCGHTEHFKEESRGSYNSARMRMGKHLMRATDEASRHREVYTAEFG